MLTKTLARLNTLEQSQKSVLDGSLTDHQRRVVETQYKRVQAWRSQAEINLRSMTQGSAASPHDDATLHDGVDFEERAWSYALASAGLNRPGPPQEPALGTP